MLVELSSEPSLALKALLLSFLISYLKQAIVGLAKFALAVEARVVLTVLYDIF